MENRAHLTGQQVAACLADKRGHVSSRIMAFVSYVCKLCCHFACTAEAAARLTSGRDKDLTARPLFRFFFTGWPRQRSCRKPTTIQSPRFCLPRQRDCDVTPGRQQGAQAGKSEGPEFCWPPPLLLFALSASRGGGETNALALPQRNTDPLTRAGATLICFSFMTSHTSAAQRGDVMRFWFCVSSQHQGKIMLWGKHLSVI